MTQEELTEVLRLHALYLQGEGIVAKPIPGFGNRFYASTCGKIFSVARQSRLREIPFALSPRLQKNGYASVFLNNGETRKNYLVHRLVAATFFGEISGKVIHHMNGIRDDNRLSNLSVTTSKINNVHGSLVRKKRASDFKFRLSDACASLVDVTP